MLQVLKTPALPGAEIMKKDAELLDLIHPEGDPILHLYRWLTPTATYGYFINPSDYFHPDRPEIHLAQRPTGGGVLFHTHDYAFSLIVPSKHPLFSLNSLDNYRCVNEVVLDSVKELFCISDSVSLIPFDFASKVQRDDRFCMAKPTKYDIVHQGMKIAGAAQRKKIQGFLHQGTISLALPNFDWIKSLLLHSGVVDAMQQYTFAPLGAFVKQDILEKTRDLLENKLIEKMMAKFSSY